MWPLCLIEELTSRLTQEIFVVIVGTDNCSVGSMKLSRQIAKDVGHFAFFALLTPYKYKIHIKLTEVVVCEYVDVFCSILILLFTFLHI